MLTDISLCIFFKENVSVFILILFWKFDRGSFILEINVVMLTFIIGLGNVLPPAYMDYMDPDVLCPQKGR